jgi:hypothetical protein
MLAVILAVAGCSRAGEPYTVPEEPMPANTVLLAKMMRELSDRPGFTETLLAELDKNSKVGAAFLTPALIDELRKMIVGKDWQGLNRFPGWTMRAIDPTVRVVGHVAGKNKKAKDRARRPEAATVGVSRFLDLGPYAMERPSTVSLNEPSTLPGFSTAGLVSDLGAGVTRGDGPNPELAPLHSESQRLADVLNRLSLNGVNGYAPVTVTISSHAGKTPEELVKALMASGHSVMVSDARYFANFGHLHYKGQDVMMPFWVNSQMLVPETQRPLLVPVAHAEYEWKVRGPKINADVSWYFGIDGKAEFRTMDTLDQAWVMGRHAHEYQGADAVEVTRLVGKMTVAYVHQHMARPALAFGGYYALGVCQDSVAAIEKKMTGEATLFPNTADVALFNDARDAEVNAFIAAVPKDRGGLPPEPSRIFGSQPVSENALQTVSIPGLAPDLIAVHHAWMNGHVERAWGRGHQIRVWLGWVGAVLATAVVVWLMWRRTKAA